ncbi:threonine/homoserine/homoserine lactone efflux protein [Desulfobaculum xiamenense]|uniref:Threonine/homoserine/homoserine lactone efflux protein n=1 Tax=Desulfobaculum xiamenense TaxID=995050 RepID=A0A846QWA1_9BACT|nr:LysE family translocator [Desulfobaculum xiamenense]NJB69384.1 threonine/homoserine/homoserine lactone efflux protein [Desulfobaculum xiamenense]
MTAAGLLALAAALFVMSATPGPAIMAVLARGMAHGLRPTLVFGLGIVAGDLCYLGFAMGGLGVVARELGWLFAVIRWAGAAYLVWMGLCCLLRPPARPVAVSAAPCRSRNFLSGLALTLGNPKVIGFYCGFLPAFVDLSALTPTDGLLAACVVGVVVYAVVVAYAWLAAGGRRLFSSGRAWRNANRTAGAVMIGAGAAVAAE